MSEFTKPLMAAVYTSSTSKLTLPLPIPVTFVCIFRFVRTSISLAKISQAVCECVCNVFSLKSVYYIILLTVIENHLDTKAKEIKPT